MLNKSTAQYIYLAHLLSWGGGGGGGVTAVGTQQHLDPGVGRSLLGVSLGTRGLMDHMKDNFLEEQKLRKR